MNHYNSQSYDFSEVAHLLQSYQNNNEVPSTTTNTIIQYLKSRGFEHKRAIYFTKLLINSWFNALESEERKIWDMRHGFLPDKSYLYNLTEDNWRNYLSDYHYFIVHPLNNHFAIWINDKLTLRYVIPRDLINSQDGTAIDLLPKYYLYIENDGKYSYLMDSPKDIEHDEHYLYNLLKNVGALAIKPSNGAGGKGFVKLSYNDGNIYANNDIISKDVYMALINDINGCIVTEYVRQHPSLDKIWKDSVCTLRVIAARNTDKFSGEKPSVICSYARFGTSISHGASNLSSGGVGVPFDFETGALGKYFYRYHQFSQGKGIKLDRHPDTQFIPEGKYLPNIQHIKDCVYSVCDHLSSLEYFGFDIMITENGVKMCEINSHPSFDYEQVMQGPLLTNADAASFFNKKLAKKSMTLPMK